MGKEYKASKKYVGVRQVAGSASWSYRFKITVNGEVLEGGKSGFSTAQEAATARASAIEDAKNRGYVVDNSKKFREVYEEWIKTQEGVKSEGTIKRHSSLFRNHFDKMFGDRYIISISGKELNEFLDDLGKPTNEKRFGNPTQYHSDYIDGFYKTLKAIFSYALRCGYVKVNRVLEVERNRHRGLERRKGQRIPDEILVKLEERFRSTNLHCAFYIGFNCGLRISEIFGLLWDDIDFDNRRVRVNKQLLYIKGTWTLSAPKTPEANREVVMSENLFLYLYMYKLKQEQQQKELGQAYRNYEHVRVYKENGEEVFLSGLPFVNRKPNGEFLTPDSGKILQRIAKTDLNYGFRWHDLRHTYATILANEQHVNINFLRQQLGHKKIESVLHYYTQVSPQVVEESTIVVNKLNIGENKPIEPVQYLDYDLVDSEELKVLELETTQSGKKLENQPKYKFINGKMVSE